MAKPYWGFGTINQYALYHLSFLQKKIEAELEREVCIELFKENPADFATLKIIHPQAYDRMDTIINKPLVLEEKKEIEHPSETQYHLGVCYEKGDGVPKDMAKAKHYWRLSSQEGNRKATAKYADALYLEALSYLKNTIIQDENKAAKLLREAAILGHQDALDRLEKLATGPYWGILGGGNDTAVYHLALVRKQLPPKRIEKLALELFQQNLEDVEYIKTFSEEGYRGILKKMEYGNQVPVPEQKKQSHHYTRKSL